MCNFSIYCEQFDFSELSAALSCAAEADCGLSAEIVIVSEEEIKNLNRETRNIDAVTDVLSYPSLDGVCGKFLKKADYPADIDENGNLFLGSIAICEKRAREQTEEYGHSFLREINYLATHGVCHLLGYDHMEEEDKRKMRALEEKVLAGVKV